MSDILCIITCSFLVLFFSIQSSWSQPKYIDNQGIHPDHTVILKKACQNNDLRYFSPLSEFQELCFVFKNKHIFPVINSWDIKNIQWHIKYSDSDKGFYEPSNITNLAQSENIFPAYKYYFRRGTGTVYVFISRNPEIYKEKYNNNLSYKKLNQHVFYYLHKPKLIIPFVKDEFYQIAEIFANDSYYIMLYGEYLLDDILTNLINNIKYDEIHE